MDKTQIQASLFLFYLRLKKPLIIFIAIATAVIVGWDNWEKYKYEYAVRNPWKLVRVNSGESLTMGRLDQIKNISLCGVMAAESRAKNYLETILFRRIGEPVFEKSGRGYDVWVSLNWEDGAGLIKDLPYRTHLRSSQRGKINRKCHTAAV